MSSGRYIRTPGIYGGNGGKRRHHVPPKYSDHQVQEMREMRAAGALIKTICWKYKASRSLVYRVLNHIEAYE